MATKTFLATPTPAALPGTTAGTKYSIQNQSEDLLFEAEAVAAPDPTDDETPKVIIPSYNNNNGGAVQADHEAGESIWLWTRPLGPSCRVGWNEV